MEFDVLEIVWNQLQLQIDSLRRDVDVLLAKSERAETAGGMLASTLLSAPLAADGGVGDGDFLFIINGRKSGEGVGAGTGIPAYYNADTDSWLRFSDDAAVTT